MEEPLWERGSVESVIAIWLGCRKLPECRVPGCTLSVTAKSRGDPGKSETDPRPCSEWCGLSQTL